MKYSQIKELDTVSLAEKLNSSVSSLYKLKLSQKLSPLENSSQIRILRKDIARIKSLINAKKYS